MASFNRVVLVGNLTRDPEKVRYLSSGTAVTDIGLAVNDRVKKGNDWVDEPTFVDITLWGRTAEVACEYLTKGAPVLIEGRLKYEQWETNEGQKRSKLKVVGEKLQMLGGKDSGNNRAAQSSSGTEDFYEPAPKSNGKQKQTTAAAVGGDESEDIPF